MRRGSTIRVCGPTQAGAAVRVDRIAAIPAKCGQRCSPDSGRSPRGTGGAVLDGRDIGTVIAPARAGQAVRHCGATNTCRDARACRARENSRAMLRGGARGHSRRARPRATRSAQRRRLRKRRRCGLVGYVRTRYRRCCPAGRSRLSRPGSGGRAEAHPAARAKLWLRPAIFAYSGFGLGVNVPSGSAFPRAMVPAAAYCQGY